MNNFNVSTSTSKINRKHLILVATTLFVAILFYLLNYLVPFYADDYAYSFSFADGERITNAVQIVNSMRAHYEIMNGRIVVHSLAQFFLLLGESYFNYINTFGFVILLYVISFHATGSFSRISPLNIALSSMFLFLSCPGFGHSFLWITGAANYLYSSLLVLLFLIPYRLYVEKKNQNITMLSDFFHAVVIFVLGILAGGSNENMSIALISMIFAFIVLYIWQKFPIHLWHMAGLIGAMIGCALMLLAPGTMNRLEHAGGSGGIITWCRRFVFDLANLLVNFRYILIGFCLLYCIWLIHKINESKDSAQHIFLSSMRNLHEKKYGIILVYVLGCIASVFSMIVSPSFPERVWSGCIILATIIFICVDEWTAKCWKKITSARVVCIFIATLISLSVYFNAFYSCRCVHYAFISREEMIAQQISTGKKIVEIPSIGGDFIYDCYRVNGDLSDKSDDFPNTAIAKYYGVEKIVRNGIVRD